VVLSVSLLALPTLCKTTECADLAVRLALRAVAPLALVPLALATSSWMVPTAWISALKDRLSRATVNALLARPTAVLAAPLQTTA